MYYTTFQGDGRFWGKLYFEVPPPCEVCASLEPKAHVRMLVEFKGVLDAMMRFVSMCILTRQRFRQKVAMLVPFIALLSKVTRACLDVECVFF